MFTDDGVIYLRTLQEMHLKVIELGRNLWSQNDWRMILNGDKNMTEFLLKPDPASLFPIREVAKGTCKLLRQLLLDEQKEEILKKIEAQESRFCSII